ncbi:hypothetical protein D3C81_1056260 [compost metagenome]
MEQLQHVITTVAQRTQRHGEIESLTTDRWQGISQRIPVEERRQQVSGGVGQVHTGLQRARRRQHLRHVQSTIGREAGGDGRTESNSRRLATGRNELHGIDIR